MASGYQPCACRDCMEIAIGEPGEAVCHACEAASCPVTDGDDGECCAPGAYGDTTAEEEEREPATWAYVSDAYGADPWSTEDPEGEWAIMRSCFEEPIGDLTLGRERDGTEVFRDKQGEVVFRITTEKKE